MIIQCPHCQTRFRLEARHLADRPAIRVRCARCHQIFTVTAPSAEEAPLKLEPAQEVRDAQVISFSNQKGGVAKTTSCLCMAVALARRDRRVLLVDFDTQANLTTLLGQRKVRSFYDLLSAEEPIRAGIVPVQDHLALLGANSRMNLLPKRYLNTQNYEQLLHKALGTVKADYDYILIDTPPSLKFFALNGLVAADLVLIPTQCAFLSLQGVSQMEQVIQSLHKRLGRPAQHRLLITLYDAQSTASQAVYRTLRERWSEQILEPAIPLDNAVSEAQILQRFLFDYAPTGKAARAYLAAAEALESLL